LAWRDNNQSGVTCCDNSLPIRRVDRRPLAGPVCVPARPAGTGGLSGTDAGWLLLDDCVP